MKWKLENGQIVTESERIPVIWEGDVVVAGGGPGGLGAAIAAKRCGAKVSKSRNTRAHPTHLQTPDHKASSTYRTWIRLSYCVHRSMYGDPQNPPHFDNP